MHPRPSHDQEQNGSDPVCQSGPCASRAAPSHGGTQNIQICAPTAIRYARGRTAPNGGSAGSYHGLIGVADPDHG